MCTWGAGHCWKLPYLQLRSHKINKWHPGFRPKSRCVAIIGALLGVYSLHGLFERSRGVLIFISNAWIRNGRLVVTSFWPLRSDGLKTGPLVRSFGFLTRIASLPPCWITRSFDRSFPPGIETRNQSTSVAPVGPVAPSTGITRGKGMRAASALRQMEILTPNLRGISTRELPAIKVSCSTCLYDLIWQDCILLH